MKVRNFFIDSSDRRISSSRQKGCNVICAPQRAVAPPQNPRRSTQHSTSSSSSQPPNTSLTTRFLRIMLLTCAVLLSCLVASASGLVVPTLSPKHTQLWQSLTYASNFERGNAPSIPRAVRTGVRLHVAPLETPSTRVSPSVTELLHGQGSFRNSSRDAPGETREPPMWQAMPMAPFTDHVSSSRPPL